jgi:hypothetical protein
VQSADDAELQAAVVAAEDRRLTEVRTVTALARWRGENWKTPYRLGTEGGYTLVLTPRSTAYTIADLLQLAPQTFLQMSDGSYLLSEHLVVMPRATLNLGAPGGLSLRLASGHDGFATILSFGGELLISGDAGSEVEITSWDLAAGEPDATTADGRAYIRAVGGQFEASYAHLSDLGFWSGRTGGLALTGTDRPNTGAIESGGSADTDGSAESSVLDGITVQPAGPIAATGAGSTSRPTTSCRVASATSPSSRARSDCSCPAQTGSRCPIRSSATTPWAVWSCIATSPTA